MTSTRKNKLCARIIGAALCLSMVGGIISHAQTLTIWRNPPVQYRINTPGTLGYALETNLTAKLSGITTNDLCPVDNVGDYPTNWTWNTSSPWHGLRGVSGLVWRREVSTNDATTYSAGGFLVSPHIMLTCAHGGAAPGSVLWFFGTNGVPEPRVSTAYENLGETFGVSDCQLVLLSGTVTNCEPLRVLPADAGSHLVYGFPVIGQSGQAAELKRLYVHNGSSFGTGISITASTNWPSLTRPLALGGDSGNAILLCLENELVGVAAWHTGYGANWQTAGAHAAINSAMSNLCVAAGIAVEQLTPVDLSGYTQL